jgi:hypothetical protein
MECEGDDGRASVGAALYASSVAAIFSTIVRTFPNRVNASSMQVLMLMDEDAMVVPVGGANEDGDGGISRGALGSVVEHKCRAMAGRGGIGMVMMNPAVAHIDR